MPKAEPPPPHPAPAPALARVRECRAVIDVGSNSVKLLVANTDGIRVDPLLERSLQTRLGEGFFQTRRLTPAAMERTIAAVATFQAAARANGARRVRVFATAATREALNRDEFLTALHRDVGLEVEVLSGDTEAEWAFRGVCSSPAFADAPLMLVDLGGGSAEFVVGHAGQRRFARSYPLGAVRLLEALALPEDPTPADLEHARSHVDALLAHGVLPSVAPALTSLRSDFGDVTFVGVGGTAVILARIVHALADFDRARIESQTVDAATVTRWVESLWALPLVRRREVPGLPPERADVMLTGALVYERILRAFDLPSVWPSTRGIRFAALMDPPSP